MGYDQLSPNLIHALIATEDERFAEHSGIDARAFVRALVKRCLLYTSSCRILFFAQNLLGVPYVANTLDGTDEERLVVHLDKVDCSTSVETLLALSLVDKYRKSDFESYKKALRCIRYRNGKQAG